MYKVFWSSENSSPLLVYESPSLEDALAFALSFHRASNKPHAIEVYDPLKDEASITLVRSAKK